MPPQQASILIVDDELSVRDSLLHWFRKDGFNVATAASATLALQALELGPFDRQRIWQALGLLVVDLRQDNFSGGHRLFLKPGSPG